MLNGRLLHEAMQLDMAEEEDWDERRDALSRLGTVDASEVTRIEGVVPRGKPPDVKRVKMDHRVVDRPAKTLRLGDQDELHDQARAPRDGGASDPRHRPSALTRQDLAAKRERKSERQWGSVACACPRSRSTAVRAGSGSSGTPACRSDDCRICQGRYRMSRCISSSS